MLGQVGSEKCLAILAQVAVRDRTTGVRIGCMQGTSSARRTATFALAQLAERFPQLADKAAAEIRALPVDADPQDNQSLLDARRQALYQITHDASLVQPYFDRLKSSDPKVRAEGVIAFRSLKLSQAPPQVVAALRDADRRVRGWTALVLGEIGDPRAVDPLMAMAADGTLDTAAPPMPFGHWDKSRAAAAADLMETLLADPDESVSAGAAVALYRITGKKARQFPPGYNADRVM